MKRRLALLLAVIASGGAAGVWVPARVAANTGLCPQPNVTSVTPQVASTGTITISGSGFSALGCAVSVKVGGATAGGVTTGPGGTVQFAVGSGLHGGVQVVLTDSVGYSNTSNGNLTFFYPVSASGVSPAAPTTGQGVTIGGQGFTLGLPAGDEHVAAAYLWDDGSTCAGASASVASNSAIAVSAPGHYCDGPVSLAISAPADLNNPAGALLSLYAGRPGSIDVAASGAQLTSPTATAGGSVGVSGSGFGSAGTATVGGAAAPSTWSDTSVSLTVPDTAVSNSPVSLTRATDGAVIGVGGALGVVARVDGVSPSSAPPGSTVTISGGGFGVHAGTVTLGSTNLPVSSWSPTSIAVTIPSGAQSGTLSITPVDTSPPASQPALGVTQQLQIGTGGAPGGASGTSGNQGTASSAPLTPSQVQQVTSALSAPPPALPPPVVGGPPPALPPSHPTNGPVTLALHAKSATAAPGKTVPFTVTLRAYGKPVANAAVQLVIAYEPAPDGSISPTSGVTDAKGELRGVLHLSRTPGEMIILARAGMFSDEVRVIGSKTTAAKVGGASTAASTLQHALPVAVVVLAALLLAVGIGLRVALALGTGSGLRVALLRERLSAGVRLSGLRRRTRTWRASWRHVQAGGDAPAEIDIAGEDEPALGLGPLDAHAAPEEA